MIIENHRKKLILPEIPYDKNIVFSAGNDRIAIGYERVVIGDRGPYVEFTKEQIIIDALHVPKEAEWRYRSNLSFIPFYYELRTNNNVMVYHQIRRVTYADYKPDFWYISPWDLASDVFPVLIKGNKPKAMN